MYSIYGSFFQRIQLVRERLSEEHVIKQEEEQILTLWKQQPVRDGAEFHNILRTRQEVLAARRLAITKDIDEPVKL